MARIVISENITLDGVIQDPTGDDGFAHGGWFNEIADEDRAGWAEVETRRGAARRGACCSAAGPTSTWSRAGRRGPASGPTG